ncbi:hypothetical protein O7632_03320 [Solwaraspora sp. WMMD406]|uniref:hypothetical protein n=1 Tax=Solwaraspora sp. WMMD406 TaxID=3016095 RepID=UPI0024167D1E|nr:hypothetical protein [Solwaraspora sp. WMMD406]MDG4763145.1 hypothetical protein [Solwaraspora sp. WMMD406]
MAETDDAGNATPDGAGQPHPTAGPGSGPGPAPPAQPPQRVRVVLADTRRRGDPDRLRADLAEQTQIGETLIRGLVRAQLALALRLAVVVAIGLGALPLLFAVAPAVGTMKLAGVNLPWLLLGVGAFPFLVAVGIAYVHLAERNEQDFTALVRRPER